MRWLAPICVAFLDDLHSTRRRLYAGGATGQSVHAASFIRERRIVFDSALLAKPAEFRRIAAHELFHFAWARLGNPARRDWELLLQRECEAHARGELGWSAEWRKRELRPSDWRGRTRRWRDYACESFCDSAAWVFTGAHPHEEATLAARHSTRRAAWFGNFSKTRGMTI